MDKQWTHMDLDRWLKPKILSNWRCEKCWNIFNAITRDWNLNNNISDSWLYTLANNRLSSFDQSHSMYECGECDHETVHKFVWRNQAS